jgi:putative oxygen-independent coproporphyrinogen III oxidase
MDPFGIYIHWPYCAAKCPYCDFNSHVARGLSEERWLAAALRELAYYADLAPGRTVSSVFIGGGTPSLMSAAAVGRLLDAVAGHWPVAADAEITMEANPSSVEAARFAGYRAAGVNRLSLGVQSLRDDQLRFLGRIHDAAEARAAIEIAKAHFPRVSFDLIYARPGQTVGDWRAELAEALALAAGHLSLYQLTIEPGTAFYTREQAGRFSVPEGEEAAALFELTQELCTAAGLPAYEVSNHARAGEESRHNLLYWRYGEYAGVGPGAHGRIVADGVRLALAGRRDPAAWAAAVEAEGHGLAAREVLAPLEEAQEMLLMGLRLTGGMSLAGLTGRTGCQVREDAMASLVGEGLLRRGAGGTIAATARGRLLLNAVIEALAEGLKDTGH